jgi:hypothetical protein
MALSAIRARNSGEGVKLEKYQSITRRDVQKIKKLEFRIF